MRRPIDCSFTQEDALNALPETQAQIGCCLPLECVSLQLKSQPYNSVLTVTLRTKNDQLLPGVKAGDELSRVEFHRIPAQRGRFCADILMIDQLMTNPLAFRRRLSLLLLAVLARVTPEFERVCVEYGSPEGVYTMERAVALTRWKDVEIEGSPHSTAGDDVYLAMGLEPCLDGNEEEK